MARRLHSEGVRDTRTGAPTGRRRLARRTHDRRRSRHPNPPAGTGWALARFGGAGTVALGSAVISYGHLRAVLVAWNYSPLAAAVGPLVLDGLMLVCGFALLTNGHTSPGGRHSTSTSART
jgi:hypothetical protein